MAIVYQSNNYWELQVLNHNLAALECLHHTYPVNYSQ